MKKILKSTNLIGSIVLVGLLLTAIVSFIGCRTDADIASTNLSTAAEQFQITRRIVFYNGITDTYILSVEGRCSVEFLPNKFEVTCKVDDDSYVKHYLGRADNVFPFVEQLQNAEVSASRYKVIFKPLQIIPDIDLVK